MKLEDIPEFEKGDIVDVFFNEVDPKFGRLHRVYYILEVFENYESLGPHVKLCTEINGNKGDIGSGCIPLSNIYYMQIYRKLTFINKSM